MKITPRILAAALAAVPLFLASCAQNFSQMPQRPMQNVEGVERMAPVTDVPRTGDTEYIDAAQRFQNKPGYDSYYPYGSRRYGGRYW